MQHYKMLLRSASEPVSPINTRAGYILKNKNPIVLPSTIDENADISLFPNRTDAITKNIIIIAVTPDAKPSKPSVKFKLFVHARIINTAHGIYTTFGISIYSFIKGI